MADAGKTKPARERWSSRAGFIAATVGSAVGLGNIWRFPYIAGENGGGVFILAYLVAVLVVGAPLMMFELAAGRRYAGGVYGTIRAMAPRAKLLGAGIALVSFVILSYYLVVASWTLGYVGITASGSGTTFESFTGSWAPALLFVATLAIGGAIVLRGVSQGIEAASMLLMPVLAVIVLGLAAYGLSLPGRGDALRFLFQPETSALLDPQVWAAAVSQAFFSLGVGTGVLMAYGSYMERRVGVRDASAVVVSADTSVAILAGLAIFPIVFTFALAPAAGPQLAFEALPRVFEQIAFGRVLGTAFYLLLFVAATTSVVSLMEGASAALSDWLGWARRRAILGLAAPLIALGALSALSYSPVGLTIAGRPVLDALDGTVGTVGLVATGLATTIAIFWLGRPGDVAQEIGEGAEGAAGRALFLMGRFLLTPALVAVLVASVVTGPEI